MCVVICIRASEKPQEESGLEGPPAEDSENRAYYWTLGEEKRK